MLSCLQDVKTLLLVRVVKDIEEEMINRLRRNKQSAVEMKDVEEEMMNRPKKMISRHLLLQGRKEKSSHPLRNVLP